MAHILLENGFTYEKALLMLGFALTQTQLREVREMYKGDMWRRGSGYIGPKPQRDIENQAELWKKIENLFTSKNLIKEIVDRQSDALLTQAPEVGYEGAAPRQLVPDPDFTPAPGDTAPAPLVPRPYTKEEEAAIDLATRAFKTFYKNAGVAETLKTFMVNRLRDGRAILRIYIPQRYLDKLGELKGKDLAEAAKALFLDVPDYEFSKVVEDKRGGYNLSLTALPTLTPELAAETQVIQVGPAGLFQANQPDIEIGFTDDEDRTFIAILKTGEQASVDAFKQRQDLQGESFDLQGLLMAYEAKGDPLITPQVVSLNNLLNLALTMAAHVSVEGGFSEMALLNVALEQEEYIVNGETRKRPKLIERGSNVTHSFVGVVNEKGNDTVYADPDVRFKEPSPIITHVECKDMAYHCALEEVRQLHALITGDAAASGEARRQALIDFMAIGRSFQEQLDTAGEWLTKVVMLLCCNLTGNLELAKLLRPKFKSHLFVGDISPDERSALLSEVEKRVRSKKSFRGS